MKKFLLIVVAILAAAAGYYYWQQMQAEPEIAQTELPPLPPPPPLPPEPAEPQARQVLEPPPPSEVPLPQLDESDSFTVEALAGLIGNPALMKMLRTEQIVRNIVATIDSLPGKRAPVRLMPIKPAAGSFLTSGGKDNLTISPKNTARYTAYMAIADALDAEKLVTLYVRLYPLFQKAYEELGYPDGYFNDRLLVVLDNLLEAPDIVEPVRLIRPKYYYLYADTALESRSIGQRILMRIGSENEAKMKAKLREIKQALLLHVHEEKLEEAK